MVHELFKYFLALPADDIKTIDIRKAYMYWFVDTFPEYEFGNEERILWRALEYHTRINRPLSEKTLSIFLDVEGKQLVLGDRIKVEGTQSLHIDDPSQAQTAMEITRGVMLQEYKYLIMKERDIEEFPISADAFMMERLNDSVIRIYEQGYNMINMPTQNGIGAQDVIEFTEIEITKLKTIYDREKIEELASTDTMGDGSDFKKVVNSGLKPIDDDMRALYTTQVLGIEAPPGFGKTRFATGVWAYRAAVKFNKNVAFYALEQSKKEIEALFLSRHVLELYKVFVDDVYIRTNDYSDFGKKADEVKAMVESARIDLFESNKYGKIKIYATDLYLETFINTLKVNDVLHGTFDLICIDYMALIDQTPTDQLPKGYFRKHLADHEIIRKAYKAFKKYIRKSKNKAGIAINQLNREGIEKAKKDQVIETTDAQGGLEVYKSTDYNIAMTATEEMKSQGVRRLSNPKVRGSAGMDRILVNTRLGSCYFEMPRDVNL